jgi:hypothetical protein
MREMAFKIIVLSLLLSAISFVATTVASMNDPSVPCYNSGYSFGLAGYDVKLLPVSMNTSILC